MRGLMQDVPLTVDTIFRHAEQHHGDVPIVTNNPSGKVRSTYGEWAQRTRRLGGVLDTLGVTADGRVGTFAWNSARHLELYFAAPCTGRVLHTLNVRLFPEQLTYIANHAEDEVVFVDRIVLHLLWPLHRHVQDRAPRGRDGRRRRRRGPRRPAGARLRGLLAGAEPVDFARDGRERGCVDVLHERHHRQPQGRRLLATARRSCTPWRAMQRRRASASAMSDVVLPVVPMFHANAWGLAHGGVGGRRGAGLPGPDPARPRRWPT